MEPLQLGDAPLSLDDFFSVVLLRRTVRISEATRARMDHGRAAIDRIVAGGERAPTVYGVNTGFGFLADVRIAADELQTLQRNLIRSHAAGVGEPLPEIAVRGMLLLRAQVLARGHSGVRAAVGELLCDLLGAGVHPIVPSLGSVGASGDLAPLAHLCLVLMGEGEAMYDGQRLPGRVALERAGLSPITLEAKEGLALVNGTQCMTSVGALAWQRAHRATRLADVIGALTLEALKGTPRAFDPRIHALRPHPGQLASAKNLFALLADSPIVESHRDCKRVQDAYSLRCMPQVHGACRDALAYVERVLTTELSAVTDNPLVFVDERGEAEFLSGGNFHGEPVAIALDLAAIATTEIGSISERRIEQLVNPHLSAELPPFLTASSGVSSGYMIAQVTAAALVSDCKILSHPASVDTIPTSANREDHVSMGTHAAHKLTRIVEHVENVLAIELLCAAQGIDLRGPLRPAPALAAALEVLRTRVPMLKEDRVVSPDIAAIRTLFDDGSLLAAVERHLEIA